MNRYLAGTLVRVTGTYSVAGAPADPDVVTLRYQLYPGASITTVSTPDVRIVSDGTGLYHFDLDTTGSLGDECTYEWLGTGECQAAGKGSFLVELPFSGVPPLPPPPPGAYDTANTWTGTQTLAGNPPLEVPGGAAGDVLTLDADGNVTPQPPADGGTVASVNGKTGTVVLAASDVGAASTGALAAEVTRAEASEALLMPVSQSFALTNLTYRDVFQRTVTGQTGTAPAFGLVLGSQTYAEPDTSNPVQGPGAWLGWNTDLLSGKVSSSSWGALGISSFADAGDTDDGAGKHGLELNFGCFRTPDGSKATNAVEVVAVNNNDNCVTLAFRCGTGASPDDGGTLNSEIGFSNADGSVQFATFVATPAPAVNFYQQFNLTPATGPAVLNVASVNDHAFGEWNAATGKIAGFQFQAAGVPKASVNYDDSVGIFYITGPGNTIPLYASSTVCYSFAPWNFEAGATVTGAFQHAGSTLGFYSATPAAKPAVSGSRGGNAALASLMTALNTLGLVTDSTTA